ncbi:MAG: hypothetical protein V7K85_06355 [Nostoc sp.]
MPNAQFQCLLGTNDLSLRQASYNFARSALVFLVQKFHKQGTNNYQPINPVVSINTYRLDELVSRFNHQSEQWGV